MSLLIVVVALFLNSTTGETAQAVQEVPSLTECAKVINDNREPKSLGDGQLWYMVKAECRVVQQ